MAVPTVPSLPAGHLVTVNDMFALTSAATWLLTKPYAHITDQSGGSSLTTIGTSTHGAAVPLVGVTTAKVNNGTSGCIDTDGLWTFGGSGTGSFLQVNTPGWYYTRYALRCATAATASWVEAWLLFTPGPSSPFASYYPSGQWMWRNQTIFDGTSFDAMVSGGGLSPFPLFAGDAIQLYAYLDSSTATTDVVASSFENTFIEAEWVSSA
jgi:hypothetical protein